MADLPLICGDSYTVRLTFDIAGTPVDLTGCRVSWTVRTTATARNSATDADALLAKVATDGDASGVVAFPLSSTDTRVRPGSYIWDAQLVDASGNVSSTRSGSIEFVQDVTKDVA